MYHPTHGSSDYLGFLSKRYLALEARLSFPTDLALFCLCSRVRRENGVSSPLPTLILRGGQFEVTRRFPLASRLQMCG